VLRGSAKRFRVADLTPIVDDGAALAELTNSYLRIAKRPVAVPSSDSMR